MKRKKRISHVFLRIRKNHFFLGSHSQFHLMEIIQSIQNRIYEIRGERVMLDKDLAILYEVSTKTLNLAVKRNLNRFPVDFMFQLTKEEFESLKKHTQLAENDESILRFQIETSRLWGGSRYLPYAFTDQGVAMLSGILRSEKAINMNIAIMRAFVEIRRVALHPLSVEQIKMIVDRINEHDMQLHQIYEALENLLDQNAAQRKWEERDRIGFK